MNAFQENHCDRILNLIYDYEREHGYVIVMNVIMMIVVWWTMMKMITILPFCSVMRILPYKLIDIISYEIANEILSEHN